MARTITKTINGVTFTRPSGRNPLLVKFEGQINPQGAYLEINGENRTIRFDYNSEIGNAVPSTVFYKQEIRIAISPYASCEELDDFIRNYAENIIELIDGYSSGYNDNGNLIGEWDWNNEYIIKRGAELVGSY